MDNGHMVLLIFEPGGEDRFITGCNRMTALIGAYLTAVCLKLPPDKYRTGGRKSLASLILYLSSGFRITKICDVVTVQGLRRRREHT